MIREAAELSKLLMDPVFYGGEVLRGDSRLVIVIPGLFGGDLYLEPLRIWLRRIGYTPVRSSLFVNAGCPMRLRDQVQRQIANWQQSKTGPLALIGHSRGGVIAWSIAVQMGERVSHLAVLGSPLSAYRHSAASAQDVPRRTQIGRSLGQASNLARRILDPKCDFPTCGCSFVLDTGRPLSHATAFLSILSRDDEVVALEENEIPAQQIVEVGGRHAALVYNPEVYRALGRFLATPAPRAEEARLV
jgi:pimeloyl-ACP methyl ester carboxylesterase